MTTPRIDVLRNQVAATAELLHMALEELEDLHVLAYERPVAAAEAKVSGGERDYALDKHGDPKARAAYRAMGEVTANACADLAQASHEALSLLRAGPSPGRGRATLRITELHEALIARERRIQRGDYTPVRRGPQPDRDQVLQRVTAERDALQQRLAKVQRKLDRAKGKPAQGSNGVEVRSFDRGVRWGR